MTIPTSTARNDYVGSGITGPYPVTFKFFEDADLRVTVDGVEKTLTTHYTLTGANVQAGGALTFVTAVDADALIAIEPRGAFDQETDIRNEGGNLRVSIEDRFDRLCRDDQVLKNLADRSLKIRTNDAATVSTVLPAPEGGAFLAWNTDADALINATGETLAVDALRGRILVDTFDAGGDFTPGTTTTLIMSAIPADETNTSVTFDGVTQHQDTYAVSDATITFSSAIPTSVLSVEVKQIAFEAVGVATHVVTVSEDEPVGGEEGDEWVQTGDTSMDAADITVDGAAQGAVAYRAATSTIGWLAAGTSGQVLKTQGAAANPIWTNAGTVLPYNVPASGDAAVGEVVIGTDTRLTDARAPLAAPITTFSFTATNKIAGRITSGAGAVEELTAAQARTVMGIDSDDAVSFGAITAPSLALSGAITGATTIAASAGITSATNVIGTDPGGSELLRVGGSIRASGGSVFASPGVFSTLTLGDNSVTSYSGLRLKGNSTQYNWQISTSNAISNGLEFALSTAATGSTYATPVMYLNSSGALILGTDPGGSELLRVGGSIRASGASITGDITLSTQMLMSSRSVIKNTEFGYSSTYRCVAFCYGVLGSGTSATLAIGVDPITITGGTFSGDGSEILLRRNMSFRQPNAGLTDWEGATITVGGVVSTGKITTVSAVPGSFADLAAVQTWLAAQFT